MKLTHPLQIIALVGLFLFFAATGTLLFSGAEPITGMAIKAPSGEKFYGAYTFKPDLEMAIDPDLAVYDFIAKDLESILPCAGKGTPLEMCIAQRQNTPELKWEFDCSTGKERVFYDIIETFEDCLNSSGTNCYCEKNLGSPAYIKRNELGEQKYAFVIEKKDDALLFSDTEGTLSYTSSLRDSPSQHLPQRLRLLYGAESMNPIEAKVSSMPLSDITPAQISFSLLFYKKPTAASGGKISSIDLIKEENGRLFYPTTAPVMDSAGKQIYKSDLKPCTPPPKNIQRFCVSDPSKKYLIYDEVDGLVKERPIVVKFAAHIPDTPPPPVESIEVFDMPKASGKVILSWKESPAAVVSFYRIYLASSRNVLETSPTAELQKKPDVSVLVIDSAQAELLPGIPTLSSCTFDYSRKKCLFEAAGKPITLEPNAVYAVPRADGSGRNLMAIIPVPMDGAPYAFSVTAVDKNGNEIDNVNSKQKMAVKEGQSIDDLSPQGEGIVANYPNLFVIYNQEKKELLFPQATQPLFNIDGSKASDFSAFAAYARKRPLEQSAQLLSGFSRIENIRMEGEGLAVPLAPLFNPKPDEAYEVVVVAEDALGNPKPETYGPGEIGAAILTLSIPPTTP